MLYYAYIHKLQKKAYKNKNFIFIYGCSNFLLTVITDTHVKNEISKVRMFKLVPQEKILEFLNIEFSKIKDDYLLQKTNKKLEQP